jgi:hypothetical protein
MYHQSRKIKLVIFVRAIGRCRFIYHGSFQHLVHHQRGLNLATAMTEKGQNGSYGELLPQRLLRRRKRPIDAGLIDLHEPAATRVRT